MNLSPALLGFLIMIKKLKRIWYLWAKALGEKASTECNKTADKVALIRTIIFSTYMVTNVAIVANAIRHWNDQEPPTIVNVMKIVELEEFERDFDYYYNLVEEQKETILIDYTDEHGEKKRAVLAPLTGNIGKYLQNFKKMPMSEDEYISLYKQNNPEAP